MSETLPPHTPDAVQRGPGDPATLSRKFYFAAWRWHFYSGLFVVPFLMMLAVTGLIMVYFNSVETRFGERLYVTPSGALTSPDEQIAAAGKAVPDGAVSQYMPPPAADRTALVQVTSDAGPMIVAVDPYTNAVLSVVNKDETWFSFASDIHGTLLIGDLGDRLIEIAAGLGIVMIVTGLFLWWPRSGSDTARFVPRVGLRGRLLWKDLHATIGLYASLVLVFFLISGLAWAGVWGGKIVQPWNSFPAEKWENVPLSDTTHASMNHSAVKEVPWGLEQTRMPESGSMAGADGIAEGLPVTLTTVTQLAYGIGFGPQFRINLPSGDTGVYTISADSMDGDTESPMGDRTVHVDRYTGKILGEVSFADYSLMAKSMAVGIALHQGDMGLWNTLLNALFCLAVLFLCISGIVMWWLRRPRGALRLAAPPMPDNLPLWKSAVFVMLMISMAFPLVGLTLIAVLAFDLFVLQSIKPLGRALQ